MPSASFVVVFGAGGDRDAGKRPLMGAIAAENADSVIVTDDNPRSENPETIRAAILATAKGAREIGDRAEAIRTAISGLQPGDALLIAGKGHETGQIVRRPDLAVQRSRSGDLGNDGEGRMSANPLWTASAMAEAMRAAVQGAPREAITGLSIDSRTIAPGEAYFAIKGDVHDGHAFVDAALKAGAALAVVETTQREKFPTEAPLLVVDDVLAALVDLAHAARARLSGQVIAVTGSVGKTSTKEALRRVLGAQGPTHASAASFNNHWGRAAVDVDGAMPGRCAVADIGDRHEPRGRDPGRWSGSCGRMSRSSPPSSRCIWSSLPASRRSRTPSGNLRRPRARRRRGAQPGQFAVRAADAPGQETRRLAHRFVRRRQKIGCAAARSVAACHVLGRARRYPRPGCTPTSSACPAVHGDEFAGGAGGGGPGRSRSGAGGAGAVAGRTAAGRGVRRTLDVKNGEAILIDESYNANPASMAAALDVLGQARIGPHGRRHRNTRRHAGNWAPPALRCIVA